MIDIVIVGAGPAGISAAIYAVSRGKNTVLIEKDSVGGVIGKVSTVTHYSAIVENETGATFAKRMERQALEAGVKIVYENVIKAELKGEVKTITTDKAVYVTKKVIIANGTTPRKLGIPGEEELKGRGIGLNASKDGAHYRDKNVYVIGGADGAVKEAIYLAKTAKKVTIVHFEEKLSAIPEFMRKVEASKNIEVLLNARLSAVYGTDEVEKLEISNEKDGSCKLIEDRGCGIFVYAGAVPNTQLYTDLTLIDGYIPVNEKMETEIPGVYAAGDIRVKQVRQAATAVADGAVAAINAAM